ncbi:MAG: M16 family metallopeptidase, partial [Candidatus Eiseniibacteriota bacterium]
APRATAQARLAHEPVLLPVAGDPTVSFKIAFTVGSQNDPAGKEGLAYLTATLMAEGATKKHPYPAILRLLYPMAAGYGARVDKELVTFSGRVHKDNLEGYVPMLLDAIREPAFDEADFVRIRQRTKDFIEKTLRYSSDEELGKATLYGTAFAGTPYAHLSAGTAAGLGAITLEDVRQFHARNFTRDAVVLAVGGGYDGALVARMQRELAQLPAGKPAAVAVSAIQAPEGRPVVIVKKPGPATAISFGFPIEARRGDRDFYALWVANSWLGEHRNSSSHLYQVIREKRGMNYGDYSYIECFPEGGNRNVPPANVPRRRQLFEVWIRPVPNDQAQFALRAAMREVESLAKNGLTKDQFELTRLFISKYSLNYAVSTDDRLGYALDDRIYGVKSPGHLANFRRIVPTLELTEVNAAIRKHLRPDRLWIAAVSEQADSLAAWLASGAPSPMQYATPKPDDVLMEDKTIEAYPLALRREKIQVVPVDAMFAR